MTLGKKTEDCAAVFTNEKSNCRPVGSLLLFEKELDNNYVSWWSMQMTAMWVKLELSLFK